MIRLTNISYNIKQLRIITISQSSNGDGPAVGVARLNVEKQIIAMLRLILDHGDPVSGAPAIGEAALDSLTDFFAFGFFIPSFVHRHDLLPTGFFR